MEEEQQIGAWLLKKQDDTHNISMMKICIRVQFWEFLRVSYVHMCL